MWGGRGVVWGGRLSVWGAGLRAYHMADVLAHGFGEIRQKYSNDPLNGHFLYGESSAYTRSGKQQGLSHLT